MEIELFFARGCHPGAWFSQRAKARALGRCFVFLKMTHQLLVAKRDLPQTFQTILASSSGFSSK